MRIQGQWGPPYQATTRIGEVEVGVVVAWEHAAWKVTHVSSIIDLRENGHDTRATLHRIHGPRHERENDHDDVAISFRASCTGMAVYRSGRVWLCSCCGHPAPCRMQVAEEESANAAQEFEKRITKMGPGICYACGEVITKRQDRITFPGEHADFPGRGAPTFHTRRKCFGDRNAYARRAGLDWDALPLVTCEGHVTTHRDQTFDCTNIECPGARASHPSYQSCHHQWCCPGPSFGCGLTRNAQLRERTP